MAEYVMFNDWYAWGRLVRRWADGTQALPLTLVEFVTQCAAANVGLTLPAAPILKGVQFVQSSDDTLLVRLPSRSMANPPNDPAYEPPHFYLDYFTKKKEYDDNFRSARIGDYSVSQCG